MLPSASTDKIHTILNNICQLTPNGKDSIIERNIWDIELDRNLSISCPTMLIA